MGTTKTIEKNASAEMFSPSVSPSAARDAEIKQSVECTDPKRLDGLKIRFDAKEFGIVPDSFRLILV